jgi:hypothetical protein
MSVYVWAWWCASWCVHGLLCRRVGANAVRNVAPPALIPLCRLLSELDAKDDRICKLEEESIHLQERCALLQRTEAQTSAEAEMGYLQVASASKQVRDASVGSFKDRCDIVLFCVRVMAFM